VSLCRVSRSTTKDRSYRARHRAVRGLVSCRRDRSHAGDCTTRGRRSAIPRRYSRCWRVAVRTIPMSSFTSAKPTVPAGPSPETRDMKAKLPTEDAGLLSRGELPDQIPEPSTQPRTGPGPHANLCNRNTGPPLKGRARRSPVPPRHFPPPRGRRPRFALRPGVSRYGLPRRAPSRESCAGWRDGRLRFCVGRQTGCSGRLPSPSAGGEGGVR